MWRLAIYVYLALDLFTFIYLMFFDGYVYNAWNWIFALGINAFLAQIWPIYWGMLHWFA